jgi:antibiotic biosynthesis monooxygenase (ABM) superfamily enzyme
MTNDAAPSSLPVTVVVSRRPAPGREAELEAWAHGIVAVAEKFPGHLAAQVFRPSPPDRDDLVIAFSFANADALSAWERSDERREWLEQGSELVTGVATTHAVSGFEGIFAHTPGHPVVPPARWKTAAIIALALYPMSLLVNWLLVPHLADLNVALRTLLSVAIIVPYMAWLGVPLLSRWLRGWLRR